MIYDPPCSKFLNYDFVKKTIEMLYQSFDQRLILDDELIVLLGEKMARNSEFYYDHFVLAVNSWRGTWGQEPGGTRGGRAGSQRGMEAGENIKKESICYSFYCL